MSSFLNTNIKFLVHMRQRMHGDNRLGLCLGAGVSADFRIPSWKGLIQRIADHPSIQGIELLKASESLTAQSQFLYQRYIQLLPDGHREGEDDVEEGATRGYGVASHRARVLVIAAPRPLIPICASTHIYGIWCR